MMGEMSQDPPFKCEGTSIPLVEEVELLGVRIDNKLKFESQIKKICRMPQSKPANHCFVKAEEVAFVKAARKALLCRVLAFL